MRHRVGAVQVRHHPILHLGAHPVDLGAPGVARSAVGPGELRRSAPPVRRRAGGARRSAAPSTSASPAGRARSSSSIRSRSDSSGVGEVDLDLTDRRYRRAGRRPSRGDPSATACSGHTCDQRSPSDSSNRTSARVECMVRPAVSASAGTIVVDRQGGGHPLQQRPAGLVTAGPLTEQQPVDQPVQRLANQPEHHRDQRRSRPAPATAASGRRRSAPGRRTAPPPPKTASAMTNLAAPAADPQPPEAARPSDQAGLQRTVPPAAAHVRRDDSSPRLGRRRLGDRRLGDRRDRAAHPGAAARRGVDRDPPAVQRRPVVQAA